MESISTETAIKIRERGLILPIDKLYEDFRVATIAAAQADLMRRMQELDKSLKELISR